MTSRLLGLFALMVCLSGALAGCQRSPFAADYPRTPYERYHLLRGDAPPLTVLDSFGNKQPALRARLAPNPRR